MRMLTTLCLTAPLLRCQVIDDTVGSTLAAASTLTADIRSNLNGGGGGNKVRCMRTFFCLVSEHSARWWLDGSHSPNHPSRVICCRVTYRPQLTYVLPVSVSCMPHAP